MHPLMGLWARDRDNHERAGWIIHVPDSYTCGLNQRILLFISVIQTDSKIVQIEIGDLDIHLPNELRKRIGITPNPTKTVP